MARTRIHNVSAAQWSANGESLGTQDLTLPSNDIFGANVFSAAEQRKRLPKHVFAQLNATIARGAELDTSLADAVAGALKLLDEALATERRFDPIGAHVAARLQLGDGRPNELRRASDRVNRHGREALQPQQTRKR